MSVALTAPAQIWHCGCYHVYGELKIINVDSIWLIDQTLVVGLETAIKHTRLRHSRTQHM